MRRVVLLAALLAACSARAATVPPLPDADRDYTFTVSAPTSVFSVPFAVYGDCTDLDVYVNGVIQSPLTYTCGSASGQTASPISDDQITLSSPLPSGTLRIVGDYRPRNLSMPTAPGVTRYEVNRSTNALLAGLREVRTLAEKATPPQLYGFWDPGTYYPVNAVVGFGGTEWQASQGSINQAPTAGSPYWQQVVSPPTQVIFSTPTLPGQPTNILAAPTIDIGSSDTHFVNVTGAAQIVSLGASCSAARPIYYLTFAGASTLVASGNLALPGGANITTAAGDSAVAQCLGNGAAQVLSYSPAAQSPISIPSGAVLPFNLFACPAGWRLSDGTNGTADLRGNFVRGVDAGAGVDPNRAVASFQGESLHSFSVTTPIGIPTNGSGFVTPNTGGAIVPQAVSPQSFIGTPTGATFGSETRPRNVALLYCQKN